MTASTLGIYNDALGEFGERKLASLTENREPRRVLDDYFPSVLNECLEDGYWRDARRTVQALAETTITPGFGYQFAFSMPSDCLQIYLVSQSGDLQTPLNDYVYEAGYLRANCDTLYLTYISNDPAYGLTLSRWSPSFTRYVAMALAERAAYRITQDQSLRDAISKRARMAKRRAESLDAREGPPRALPEGTWVASRRGGWVNSDCIE